MTYEDLAPGDSGDAVLALQRRLVELGYADGTPNGKYGPATISAVSFYQQCNGLEQDGMATAWLQSVLFSNQALTYDQTRMLAEGFDTPIEGDLPSEEEALAKKNAELKKKIDVVNDEIKQGQTALQKSMKTPACPPLQYAH